MRHPRARVVLGAGWVVGAALVAGGCTTGSPASPDPSSATADQETAAASPQAVAPAASAEETHVPARERGVLTDSPDAGPAAVLCEAAGSEDAGVVEQAFALVHSDVDHVVLALYDEGRGSDAERVRTIKQELSGAVADHDDARLVDVARDLSTAVSTATAAEPDNAAEC